ncbi:MAG: dTDP-4-dehydrorhamnose 3,5-epimerase [Acidobacteria bacterium]|nr:dTDP-4-dehydrorhamnose 3,5-epimerase [Acidobacteriota bacterium]
MIVTEIVLRGAFLLDLEPVEDQRGFFARLWCADEFRKRGLESNLAQMSISYNRLRGTVRGMHYQAPPHEETKLIRCTAGAIHDVIIDLRTDSSTLGKWYATELSARDHRMFYIPRGFAHGFQSLEDGTEVQYMISAAYHPEAARGVRWDDPAFGIRWPLPVSSISERDLSFPPFASHAGGVR